MPNGSEDWLEELLLDEGLTTDPLNEAWLHRLRLANVRDRSSIRMTCALVNMDEEVGDARSVLLIVPSRIRRTGVKHVDVYVSVMEPSSYRNGVGGGMEYEFKVKIPIDFTKTGGIGVTVLDLGVIRRKKIQSG